jgi:hypothetical protein
MAALSIDAWGDIAQLAIAVTGVLAIFGAAVQIKVARSNARRARAYEYADRFNRPEMISLTARYTDYWKSHSFTDFEALSRQSKSKLLVLPNVIEEAAAAYERKLIDRDVAAQMLGVLVEVMWKCSHALVAGARADRHDDWIYAEWEAMQKDTFKRRMRARKKTRRRRALRAYVQLLWPLA